MHPKIIHAVLLLVLTGSTSALSASSKASLHFNGRIVEYPTITEALAASREYGLSSDKTIVLEAGRTFLEDTILLDARDTGLTIRSVEGETSELIGGRLITGWQQGENDFWTAPVPDTMDGSWNFRTLLVDGRVADRARYPESGRLQNRNKWDVRWLSTAEGGWERKPTVKDLTQMTFREGDLSPDLELENAEFTVFHKWDETLVAAERLIPDTNTVVFSNPTGHPFGAFGVKDYVVWNIAKGMTRPGQWYLDRIRGEVVYWPLPGEDMATLEVIAPTLENVIRLENTENVTLSDLRIRASTTPLIVGDFAAKLFDGAVSARNANYCVFENLEITGVTGWGLKLFGDHLTVKNCHVHAVGAGAIRLIGSHGLIENNHLHNLGLVYPSAIALYIGVTDPNMEDEWISGKDETHVTLRHNEIYDSPYIGIGIGGSDHIVEFNKVSRVMQELADGSGIYATFCGDMVMRNNVVRDIEQGKTKQNHAYYLDELSDGVVVENNIAINVPTVSHNHMAKNNLFRNNIFINPGTMRVTIPRSGPHTYERNIFVSDSSVTFVHPKVLTLKGNLFQVGKVLEQISERYEKTDPTPIDLPAGNRIGDAGLIIDGDDISFKPDSLAVEMGIQPIKGSRAGLLPVDFENVRSARTFYVAPDGSPDANGTKRAPLQTIQQAVDLMEAGDSVFVRGGIYRETVEFKASGQPEKPLRLQAYKDEPVVLDGSAAIDAVWERHEGNIYKTRVEQLIEQLFVGKQMMIEARWPNMKFEERFDRERWARVDRGSTHGFVLSKAIAETGIDWTGAMANLNVAHQWWTWNRPITQHEAGSDRLEYDADLVGLCNYDPEFWKTNEVKPYAKRVWNDDSFYLFGLLEALDVETEWHYEAETQTLYFYAPDGVDPSTLEISYKARDYGIRSKDQDHLEIVGIDFFACTFLIEDGDYNLVEDCELLYPSYSRTITEYDADRKESVFSKIVGDHNTVRRCSLAYSNNMGLMVMGNYNVVENCIIHDVNWSGTLIYPALQLSGSPHLGVNWFDTIQYPPTERTEENSEVTSYGNRASYNTLYNCGNSLLVYHAAESIVEYNHVYGGGKACKDVSLIYGCWPFSRDSIIRYNWVHDCYPDHGGIGIRADDQSRGNIFHHNVVWDSGGVGIAAKGEDHEIYNNTIFNIGGNGPRKDYIFAPIRAEPVKVWAVQWPQLEDQNQRTRILNNFSYNIKYWRAPDQVLEENERINHNITGIEIPPVLNAANFDFRPLPDSVLIDTGVEIPGITNGFTGQAPDVGAYEASGERWVPGANWEPSFTKLEK